MPSTTFALLLALTLVPAAARAGDDKPPTAAEVADNFDIQSHTDNEADRFCAVTSPSEKGNQIYAIFFTKKFSECEMISETERDGFRESTFETHVARNSLHDWAACYKYFHDGFVKAVPKDAKQVSADPAKYASVKGEDYDLMIDANGHLRPRWECGDLGHP